MGETNNVQGGSQSFQLAYNQRQLREGAREKISEAEDRVKGERREGSCENEEEKVIAASGAQKK